MSAGKNSLTPGHANLVLENLALNWEKQYGKSGFSDVAGTHLTMDIPHLIGVVGRLKKEVIQMTNEQYIDVFGFGRNFIMETKQYRQDASNNSPYSKSIRNMIAGVFLNEMSEGVGFGIVSSQDINDTLLERENLLNENEELKRQGEKPLTIGSKLGMTEGLAISRAYGNSIEAWNYLFIDGRGMPNLNIGPSPIYYRMVVDMLKAFGKANDCAIDWSLIKKFDEMSETVALVSCLGGAVIDKLSQHILKEIQDRMTGCVIDPYNLKSRNCYADNRDREGQIECMRRYGSTPFHRTEHQKAYPMNRSIWGTDFDVQGVYNKFDLDGALTELRNLGKNKDHLSRAYRKYYQL